MTDKTPLQHFFAKLSEAGFHKQCMWQAKTSKDQEYCDINLWVLQKDETRLARPLVLIHDRHEDGFEIYYPSNEGDFSSLINEIEGKTQ